MSTLLLATISQVFWRHNSVDVYHAAVTVEQTRMVKDKTRPLLGAA